MNVAETAERRLIFTAAYGIITDKYRVRDSTMEGGNEKNILFSAVQPSGVVTIGNYIGAIKNWVSLQSEYRCFYAGADLHAIPVKQEPDVLR